MNFSNSLISQLFPIRKFNTNARKLITANFLFGLFNPFYLIFSSTFIYNVSKGDIAFNLLYSGFSYIGISLGFVLAGYLVRLLRIRTLMVLGAVLMFIAIMAMFLLSSQWFTKSWMLLFGFATGLGVGIYWAARNYLTVVNTSDGNRDFYAGIDFILISLGRILTPLLVGIYIGEGVKHGWFSQGLAYKTILIPAFLLVLFIALVILPRKFRTVEAKPFLFMRYNKEWLNARIMTVVWGYFSGMFIAIPPVLIMKYIGNESQVGILSALTYAVAMIIVYFISSRSSSRHRTGILKAGVLLQSFGVICFAILLPFNSMLATTLLIISMFLADPIIGFPFRATFMKAIDDTKKLNNRTHYAYVVDIEISCGIGRITALGTFYLLYITLPEHLATIIFMGIVVLLQFLYIPLSKRINGV